MNFPRQLSRSTDISARIAAVFQRRTSAAQAHYSTRVRAAYASLADLTGRPASPWDIWTDWYRYSVDFAQRSMLFWDTMRQRGNNFSSMSAPASRRCSTSSTR